MKTWGKVLFIVILCGLGLLSLASGTMAGETGEVTCSTSGCGYKNNLTIGGAKRSPSFTGYCPKEKNFVRVNIKSWEDYRQPHHCPNDQEPLQPIYDGSDVAKIPCPQCGSLTLTYKRKLFFD
jgi:hypothetical protein